MDDLDRHLNDVNPTKLFFTDLKGRRMNLSVNKIKNIFNTDVGFDGSSMLCVPYTTCLPEV